MNKEREQGKTQAITATQGAATTALATTSGALVPSTYAEAERFAELVARSSLCPKDHQGKPGNVLVAIIMGAEVGLSPMQSIQNIAVIGGRPSLWGDALLGVCQARPDFEDIKEEIIGEGDGLTAMCAVFRKGRSEVVASFSVADAKKAGLWGKVGPWQNYPQRMLKMRARGFALRDAFADALRGLQSAEESQDIETHQRAERRPQAQRQQPQQHVVEADVVEEEHPSEALADVLASIESSRSIADLEAVASDAAALDDGERQTAKAAYKRRLAALRAEAFADTTVSKEEPGADG